MGNNARMTPEELEALKSYLVELEELEAQEPEYDFSEEGSSAWEAWNKRSLDLTHKYDAYIRKAIILFINDADISDQINTSELIRLFLSKTEPKTDDEPLEGQTSIFKEPQTAQKGLIIRRPGAIEYPIDKVNAVIWSLLEHNTNGQMTMPIDMAPDNKQKINAMYSVDFDALEDDGVTVMKKLTQQDKRVYIAAGSIFNAGNKITTLTQIYYAMGYTGNPGKSDLEKIYKSVNKMAHTWITLENSQEAKVFNYPKYTYKGSILPSEFVEETINGKLTDVAIRLFREPPVIEFAKGRKQVTTLDIKILQSPVSKTDANLQIEDYLIVRISRAKNGKSPTRILYQTIYEKAGITTKKQRQRAPEKISKYLDHYKEAKWISGYTTDKRGITISP